MDTRCRELRLAAGLSQAEVARAVGMSQNAISSLERGDTVLDLVWMRRLAPLYGCTPADFLADADNPDRLTAEEAALIRQLRRAADATRAAALAAARGVLGLPPFKLAA